MKDKIQIQITSIENGFLVASPRTKGLFTPRSQEEAEALAQPVLTYCATYEDVCKVLGGIMMPPSIVR